MGMRMPQIHTIFCGMNDEQKSAQSVDRMVIKRITGHGRGWVRPPVQAFQTRLQTILGDLE